MAVGWVLSVARCARTSGALSASMMAWLSLATIVAGVLGGAEIAFLHCPFRELAEAYPELVCNLHRGLCEGVVNQAGAGSVVGFSTLYQPDPCHVVVAVS